MVTDFEQLIGETLAWRNAGRRIDCLNLSLGVTGFVELYGRETVLEHFEPLFPVLLQKDSEEKVIFVWSAGNSHGTDCDLSISQCATGTVNASSVSLLAGRGAYRPELQDMNVAVVAMGPDGETADFSNRCGIAEEFCLAAPGDEIRFRILDRQRVAKLEFTPLPQEEVPPSPPPW